MWHAATVLLLPLVSSWLPATQPVRVALGSQVPFVPTLTSVRRAARTVDVYLKFSEGFLAARARSGRRTAVRRQGSVEEPMTRAPVPSSPSGEKTEALLSSTELPPALMSRLATELGVVQFNTLQRLALPPALLGRDLLVHAETGAGKTLCFVLPVLASLLEEDARQAKAGLTMPATTDTGPQPLHALVLSPTLELCAQTAAVLNALRPGAAVALTSREMAAQIAAGGSEALALLGGARVLVAPPALALALASGNATTPPPSRQRKRSAEEGRRGGVRGPAAVGAAGRRSARGGEPSMLYGDRGDGGWEARDAGEDRRGGDRRVEGGWPRQGTREGYAAGDGRWRPGASDAGRNDAATPTGRATADRWVGAGQRGGRGGGGRGDGGRGGGYARSSGGAAARGWDERDDGWRGGDDGSGAAGSGRGDPVASYGAAGPGRASPSSYGAAGPGRASPSSYGAAGRGGAVGRGGITGRGRGVGRGGGTGRGEAAGRGRVSRSRRDDDSGTVGAGVKAVESALVAPGGLLGNLRLLVLDEADAMLGTLGRYATKAEKESRASHPKPAAVLLKTLQAQRARAQIDASARAAPLQVLGASATVGRPLRREIQSLIGRKVEVAQLPSTQPQPPVAGAGPSPPSPRGPPAPDTASEAPASRPTPPTPPMLDTGAAAAFTAAPGAGGDWPVPGMPARGTALGGSTVSRDVSGDVSEDVSRVAFEDMSWDASGDVSGGASGEGRSAGGRAVGLPSTLRVSVLTCEEDNIATALQQAMRLGEARASAGAAPAGSSAATAPATLVFVGEGRALGAELRLLQQTGLPQAESLADFLARGGALPRRPPGGAGAKDAAAAASSAGRTQAGAVAGMGAAARESGPVIVAAQSTARGLDLPGVGLVLIVGLPSSADSLLHLAGRTARQGADGRVVLIATERECNLRLGLLSAQLGVDLKADVARVAGRDEGWARVWRVHQQVTQADKKYR